MTTKQIKFQIVHEQNYVFGMASLTEEVEVTINPDTDIVLLPGEERVKYNNMFEWQIESGLIFVTNYRV